MKGIIKMVGQVLVVAGALLALTACTMNPEIGIGGEVVSVSTSLSYATITYNIINLGDISLDNCKLKFEVLNATGGTITTTWTSGTNLSPGQTRYNMTHVVYVGSQTVTTDQVRISGFGCDNPDQGSY